MFAKQRQALNKISGAKDRMRLSRYIFFCYLKCVNVLFCFLLSVCDWEDQGMERMAGVRIKKVQGVYQTLIVSLQQWEV